MKLVAVPTPIGNLKDLTARAEEILRQCDFAICEDTRETGKLFSLLGISKPLVPFHLGNEHRALDRVVERIQNVSLAVLVSDAGTPGISDPGFLLIRACITEGIPVECLPGATAFVPALVVSGLPCERFVFEGFLPHKKGRETRCRSIAAESRTTVLYESPHRIVKTLLQLAEHCGPERPCAVARELTKMHEEVFRGTLSQATAHFSSAPPRGEFVIVLGGRAEE